MELVSNMSKQALVHLVGQFRHRDIKAGVLLLVDHLLRIAIFRCRVAAIHPIGIQIWQNRRRGRRCLGRATANRGAEFVRAFPNFLYPPDNQRYRPNESGRNC
jgi:hypothetical protein